MLEFDETFRAWLESHEPGEQLDDLRLTMELQDVRRQYQSTYVNLDIQRSQASARVTEEPPDLVNLKLQKVDGTWQIQP